MYLASRGFGKSFMLAVYSMLKAILCPNHKVIVTGAAFRQSKVIYEYCANIWVNAPILRDICGGGKDGPKSGVDRCIVRMNGSTIMAIPIGNGDKIIGLRANTIVADEFDSMNPDIYEIVIAGFAAVSASPAINVKEAARRKALQELGVWTADSEKKYNIKGGNQSIIA